MRDAWRTGSAKQATHPMGGNAWGGRDIPAVRSDLAFPAMNAPLQDASNDGSHGQYLLAIADLR